MSGVISVSPDMQSGIVGKFPTGQVIQVARGVLTSAHSTTSTSYVDTGLSATFTTLGSGSSIFISAYFIGQSNATAVHVGGNWNLDRNGTAVSAPLGDGFYINDGNSNAWNYSSYCNIQMLDQAALAGGTAITYKLQSRARASGPTLKTGHNGDDSFMTIFEIEV